MAAETDHAGLAEQLRQRVTGAGAVGAAVRLGAMRAGAGESTELPAPFADLARTVGEASYRVTDAQVAAVREAAGSDKKTFEVVMSASVGAGLRRWDATRRAMREVSDAAG